jgi:hypothetical protein
MNLAFAEYELNLQLLIILLAIIFIGFPFIILVYHIVRRLVELHKLTHPIGTLFVTKDREVYLELDDSTIIDHPSGMVVLRVSKTRE